MDATGPRNGNRDEIYIPCGCTRKPSAKMDDVPEEILYDPMKTVWPETHERGADPSEAG
jgi:hypothetical protein